MVRAKSKSLLVIQQDTKPHLKFNENGVCDACIAHENKKNINWDQRKKELIEILEKWNNNEVVFFHF